MRINAAEISENHAEIQKSLQKKLKMMQKLKKSCKAIFKSCRGIKRHNSRFSHRALLLGWHRRHTKHLINVIAKSSANITTSEEPFESTPTGFKQQHRASPCVIMIIQMKIRPERARANTTTQILPETRKKLAPLDQPFQ